MIPDQTDPPSQIVYPTAQTFCPSTFLYFRDLIEYHMRTGKPVTQSSGAILLNPISRPDWQLDNKDVILLEKIGQVSPYPYALLNGEY